MKKNDAVDVFSTHRFTYILNNTKKTMYNGAEGIVDLGLAKKIALQIYEMKPTLEELAYVRSSDGFTLLHLAITSHNPYLVALYSHLGADINARAIGGGVTPCELIAKTGHLVEGMVSAFWLSENYLIDCGIIKEGEASYYHMMSGDEKTGVIGDEDDLLLLMPKPMKYLEKVRLLTGDSHIIPPERTSSLLVFEELEDIKDAFGIPEDLEGEMEDEISEESAEDNCPEILIPEILLGCEWVPLKQDDSKDSDKKASLEIDSLLGLGATSGALELLEEVIYDGSCMGEVKEDIY